MKKQQKEELKAQPMSIGNVFKLGKNQIYVKLIKEQNLNENGGKNEAN